MQNSVEQFILHEVQPRLRTGIPQSVPLVGCDDVQELVQDGTVMALAILTSAQASGRNVTGGNVAFYTIKSLRSGRRSTGQRKGDVLNPMAQLNGAFRVHPLDETVGCSDDCPDGPLTFVESLAARTEDPAEAALRRLDWAPLVASLDPAAREVLGSLMRGEDLTKLVPRLKRSRSALQNDKERLARLVRTHLGEDVLRQVQEPPRWMDNLTARNEKTACRAERQMR